MGTRAINLAQFIVIAKDHVHGLALDTLLTLILSEEMGVDVMADRNPEAKAYPDRIRREITEGRNPKGGTRGGMLEGFARHAWGTEGSPPG